MNQKEEISLYHSKLNISLTDMLNREGIKIRKTVYSQYRGILKPLIYRLILVCNVLEDSQRRGCLSRLSLTSKAFNHAV